MSVSDDLFSDDVFGDANLELDPTDDCCDGNSWMIGAVTAVVLLSVAVGAYMVWPSGSHKFGTDSITVSGANVGALKAGAPVMLEQVQVGEVESVAIRRGVPVASLKVNREYRNAIPSDSQFEVGSLNWLLPGNIGVKVVPADEMAATASGRAIEIVVDDSILPPEVPRSGYAVMAVLLAVAATAVGVVLKIARSAWLGKSLVILTLAAAGYLLWSGTWNMDQVQDLLNQIPTQVDESSDTGNNFVSQD